MQLVRVMFCRRVCPAHHQAPEQGSFLGTSLKRTSTFYCLSHYRSPRWTGPVLFIPDYGMDTPMFSSWQINHTDNNTPAMQNKCQIYNCFPGSVIPFTISNAELLFHSSPARILFISILSKTWLCNGRRHGSIRTTIAH